MEYEEINIKEINNIPKSEFRKHFLQWIDEDGVARALQAKLRKDLIDNFNKTHLGRQIQSNYYRSRRMILTPLILALNTLVAEFLYEQNCHFSLSVFSTEVPYRNTLPDFENQRNFRFNNEDLLEIFEAIAIGAPKQLTDEIIQDYIENNKKTSCSLLFCIISHLFRGIHKNVASNITKRDVMIQTTCDDPIPEKKDNHKIPFDNQFHYLNKYLIILSKKVKEMSSSLDQLKKVETQPKTSRRKSVQNRRIECLNRSLERISSNLRHLSITKRKNQKLSSVISSIDRISQQLEKCTMNFEKISQNIIKNETKENLPKERNYTDWVNDLKTTKSGKKFMDKIEITLRKNIEREKEILINMYEKKFETEKILLKMKYKHKLLEQLRSAMLVTEKSNNNKIITVIEEKILELERKHQQLQQDTLENNTPFVNDCNLNIEKEIIEKPPNEKVITDTIPTEKLQLEKSTQHEFPDINLKPQIEEMTRTIVEQERNVDHIIFNAKLRIQELEHESIKLDQSFQEYLQKQRNEKDRMERDASSIWENYNREKTILNTKCTKRYTPDICPKYKTLSIDIPENIEMDFSKLPKHIEVKTVEFENPFKQLQNKIGGEAQKVSKNKKSLTSMQFTEDVIASVKETRDNDTQTKSNYPNVQTTIKNSIKSLDTDQHTLTDVKLSLERINISNSSSESKELIDLETKNDKLTMKRVCEPSDINPIPSTSKHSIINTNNTFVLSDAEMPDTKGSSAVSENECVLREATLEVREQSSSTSNSYSNKLNISTGKQDAFSSEEFWN